jgi:uncharacterized protein YcgL (UPF0745 family)
MAQISDIREAMARGDFVGALRIATKLRGHQPEIGTAWQAMQRPDFYRQLGKDPEQLIAAGNAALFAQYGSEAGNGK